MDVQTVQDHVDACFQASLAGIDLAKCRKPGVPVREAKAERAWRERERWIKREGGEGGRKVERRKSERERKMDRRGKIKEEEWSFFFYLLPWNKGRVRE